MRSFLPVLALSGLVAAQDVVVSVDGISAITLPPWPTSTVVATATVVLASVGTSVVSSGTETATETAVVVVVPSSAPIATTTITTSAPPSAETGTAIVVVNTAGTTFTTVPAAYVTNLPPTVTVAAADKLALSGSVISLVGFCAVVLALL